MNSIKNLNLRKFNIFKDFSDDELKSIEEFMRITSFPAKSIILTQNDESDVVYFIQKGLVRAYRNTEEGQEINLNVLGEGETIGEMGIIEELPRSATIEAIKDTEILYLTKENFLELLRMHPKISINLLKLLSKRLRNLTEKVEGVMSKNIEERTLEALKILSKLFPDNEILLSHEEISIIVGATRARVTEALDVLKNKQKIKLNHRKIKLL